MLNEENSGGELIDRDRKIIKKYLKNGYLAPIIDYEYQDEENRNSKIWLHISSEPWNTLESDLFDTFV